MEIQKANQPILWNSDCAKLQTVDVTFAEDGHPILAATGTTPDAPYYLSVKYDTASVKGTSVSLPYPTVDYTFITHWWTDPADHVEIITSWDSVALVPK